MILKIIERHGVFHLRPQVVRVVRVYDFKVPSGITTTSFTQKGGILVGTGSGTFVEFPPGSNGKALVYDSTQPAGVNALTLESTFPPGHRNGLTIANNATDPTNDIDVGTGTARNDTDVVNMRLTSAMTKRLDAAWVAGNGNGGLDTGSKTNSTWYHIFLIAKGDGTVDWLFSTNATSPTMPTGYIYKRWIWSVYVDSGGTIRLFKHNGRRCVWKTPVLDVDVTNVSTTRGNHTIQVPPGEAVWFVCNTRMSHASSHAQIYLSNPNLTDSAPSLTAAPLSTPSNDYGGVNGHGMEYSGWTDASSQISSRANDTSTTLKLSVREWEDSRY